jgi:pyridinium-3,5-biscarboxylic acid mononucleotide sulfurtransferase
MTDYERLVAAIAEMGGVAVGYSGGVDSTLVAKAATDALGEKAVCVLIDSCFIPRSEIDEAVSIAAEFKFNLTRVRADALGIPNVSENEPDRCYHCKKGVFSIMVDTAQRLGLDYVLDGTNVDDGGDYRPGERATKELGIRSPLKELGFSKEQVRETSKQLGISNWDKPSYACLASRVPYGTPLTREILGQVEAAESTLHELGFKQCRVRHHGEVARIELIPEEMDAIFAMDTRNLVAYRFRSLGYKYVALDLLGYRMGSMNEPLTGADVNVKEWGVGNK